jgi:TRAP-type C4-dicarboxylate transport system substrate-binding protein
MNTTPPPRFHYRLGVNQPAHSPTARRLAEMAEAIGRDTDGAFQLDVFPESRLGPDPQMFADVRQGALDFYLAGATLGGIAPSSALPLLPFTFADNAAVFAALDGALGDVIRGELHAAGLHAFRHGWLNGFHHITTSNRPIRDADDFAGFKIAPRAASSPPISSALGRRARHGAVQRHVRGAGGEDLRRAERPARRRAVAALDEVRPIPA